MKRLSKNFFSIIGSDIIRRVLGFLTIAYLARKIGVANFGAVNIGFTVLSYALMMSSAGLTSFGARAIARGEKAALINIVTTFRLISSSGAFIIVSAVAVFFIPDERLTVLIILFCAALFPNVFRVEFYFQGRERMGINGIAGMVSAFLYLSVVILFVRSANDFYWVAIASVCGDSAASLIVWINYRLKENGSRLKLSLMGWKSMLSQSLPMGGGAMLANFSINLPPIVVGIVLTNTEVGLYGAASKLVFFLLMLDRVIATLLLPASSRLHSQSPELLTSTLSYALKWIVITAFPVCIGGTILAGKIIPMIFGNQYLLAVDISRILIWFFLLTMLHTIYTSGMIAIGREKMYLFVMMVSAVLYLISLVVFTFFWGAAGAAGAVLFSEAAAVLYMRLRVRKFIHISLPVSLFKIIFSAAAMGLLISLFPGLNLFLSIFTGAVVYAILLFATKAVTAEDVYNLRARF